MTFFVARVFDRVLCIINNIHKAVMDLMYTQIKHKLELDDPEVKSSKIQGMLNLYTVN